MYPITDEELEAIRERNNLRANGPWLGERIEDGRSKDCAEDVPALLAEVDRLRAFDGAGTEPTERLSLIRLLNVAALLGTIVVILSAASMENFEWAVLFALVYIAGALTQITNLLIGADRRAAKLVGNTTPDYQNEPEGT